MGLPEIKGFLETSFVDWPGRLAAVLFLPHCNFRCPYCHNHRLVCAPETLATLSLERVLARLDGFRDWIDGVCVTGGEPTLQPGLAALLGRLREAGWPVKLDTNGSQPEVLAALLRKRLLAAVALDVKAPLEAIPYRRNAGVGADPGAVRASLELLAASDLPLEVRTTVHPRLLSRDEVVRLAASVGAALAGAGRRDGVSFRLQRCRVEDALEAGLRDHPALDPEPFGEWEREAQDRFRAGLAQQPA